MKETTPREKVLKKIRSALMYKTQAPEYTQEKPSSEESESDEIRFATQFLDNGGKFIFCESVQDISRDIQILVEDNNWEKLYCGDKDLVELLDENTAKLLVSPSLIQSTEPDAAIILCDLMIADTGSVLISSNLDLGIPFTALPDLLIIVAGVNQVLPDWKTSLKTLAEIYPGKALGQLHVLNGKKHKVNAGKDRIGKDVFLFLIENTAV